ncbi:hypothetical protein [Coprobacter fastidiosus]|jgi:hypothetical protein|uniref:hypothetical protein n=1 Tax=Coprobacter fastidiosus TaxID=1099853 RepID=UPI00241E7998|nr:hypothetical protein [Coprobacter fastidiosus]MBS6269301.1 hypothetical protein [Tannerella sp.]
MDIKEMMRAMIILASDKEPSVGIFWFLPEKHDLFEVHSKVPSSTEGIHTIHKLHRDVWKKAKFRAKARGEKDSIYYQDYTKIPRGRVFYNKGKFTVAVGSWYKKYEEELTNLLKDYFDLEEFDFEVIEYFELGHNGGEEEFLYNKFI